MSEVVFTPQKPSQAAINNVSSPLPIPTECNLCGGVVVVKHYNEIYSKHIDAKYPWSYVCTCCDARVGIHKDTNIPLGYLADEPLRIRRIAVKTKFIALYKNRGNYFYGDKSAAYRWLSQTMGLCNKNCHFGFFNTEQCNRAEELIDVLTE